MLRFILHVLYMINSKSFSTEKVNTHLFGCVDLQIIALHEKFLVTIYGGVLELPFNQK